MAIPYYGVGVFMPITVMGMAVRQHFKHNYAGRARRLGMAGASASIVLSGLVFFGQIVGKWEEGGWVVLISFSLLILLAHAALVSPSGARDPRQIFRIVRQKARVQGAMGSIVEWQSLKMQEYRYGVLKLISRAFEAFGIRRPDLVEPVPAGDYDHAVHSDHPEAPSILAPYLDAPATHGGGS
jgi:hypothetical protein